MAQKIVVKIGTSSLTNSTTGQLGLSTIASLVETLSNLRRIGYQVILVSSGAVGIGCVRLNLKERPRKISLKQAVAAVGQGRLIRVYDDLFNNLEQPIAQILLTRRDLVDRNSYLNVYNTFMALLDLGIIPIVNENDTVAIDELKFGDNDTLSALVASLVEADWLFLLTDVDRLYSADPRFNPEAKPIILVNSDQVNQLEVEAGSSGSGWGTGGMVTKLEAARIATSAGVRMVITHGQYPQNIEKILQGEVIGTHFEANSKPDSARKRWIAYGMLPRGKLYVDQGAVIALKEKGRSLLPAGITQVEGSFGNSEAVILCDPQGKEFAKGIVNYSSTEIELIKGHQSEQIGVIVGYDGAETVIHRDNLIITS